MYEKRFLINVVFADNTDDLSFELFGSEFNEPNADMLDDIGASKQILYFLSEIFGETLYEFMQQDEMNFIEDTDFSNILELQITDCEEDITYYINFHQCTLDKE